MPLKYLIWVCATWQQGCEFNTLFNMFPIAGCSVLRTCHYINLCALGPILSTCTCTSVDLLLFLLQDQVFSTWIHARAAQAHSMKVINPSGKNKVL